MSALVQRAHTQVRPYNNRCNAKGGVRERMTPLLKRRKLGEILAESGVAAGRIEEAVSTPGNGTRIGERLIAQGIASEEAVARALAEQYGYPFLDLPDYWPSEEAMSLLPIELLYRETIVPVPVEDGGQGGSEARPYGVAISDPTRVRLLDEVERRLARSVAFFVAPRSAIEKALKRGEGTGQVVRTVAADMRIELVPEEPGAAPATFVADVLDPAAGPAVRLLSSVITDALAKRASDIHVEATGAALLIKYRIDGVLYEGVDPLDPAHHGAVVARLKVMAELDLAESRVPQDGRFRLKANGKEVDFRVSILPSIHGEDAVIRILDREAITAGVSELRLERLGFPEADLARFRRTIAEPYGMVLVTGPTGSGKTTTLYAAISEINTGEEKIITIEDPVEYELPGVVQIPVNEKKGLTFARGLRSVLRHDPDKILVGEIRDPETAQIAVQSALTGHLVFTTVHANNAFDVIGRFLNMGIEPYNFVSSLSGILAQRLVRVLCAHCKRAAEPDAERLRASGLTPDSLPGPIFDAAGCPECHGTGYRGRLAITEYLVLTDAIREMIVGRRPSTEIRKEALAGGMTTLRQSAVAKVAAGITTLREIDRVTFVE